MGVGQTSRLPAWAWKAITFLLWLFTSALGLGEIYLTREIAFSIYARFWRASYPAYVLGYAVIFIMGMIWIAYVFGTGEYHWKKAGTPGSWQIFTWAIAIELLILILYFVI